MRLAEILIIVLAFAALWLWLRLRARVLENERQEIELGMLRRELKRMQSVLALAREHYSVVAAATFDALILLDTNRTVLSINQVAEELFNVVPDQAVGQTCMVVTRNHELDALVSAALDGEDLIESHIGVDSRTLKIRIVVTRSAEQVVIALAFQDITELLRLSRARRDMVANLSHDLRTPIANIRLLLDTLSGSLGRNPERDQRLLSKLASAADSLQHMTQELIDLSMIESGKAIMRMVETNLDDIVHAVTEMMDTQLDEKKISLVSEIPPGLRVLVDSEQIHRVLSNIIHNAIKFTPSGGQIALSAQIDEGMVTFSVRDTGPGIPPHERARVFERFYQVDSPRTGEPKRNGRGTGLGLAIAKHIVEAHGGKIWAEGGIPNGAIIVFTLPLGE